MILYTHLPPNECISRLQDPASIPQGDRLLNDREYCRWDGTTRIKTEVFGPRIRVDLLGARKSGPVSFRGILYQDNPSGGTVLQGRFPRSLSTIVGIIVLILIAIFPVIISAFPSEQAQPGHHMGLGSYFFWYGLLFLVSAMAAHEFFYARNLLKNFLLELLEASDVTSTHRSSE